MHQNSLQTCPANIIQTMAVVLQNPGEILIDAEDFAQFASNQENIQCLILEDEPAPFKIRLEKSLQELQINHTNSKLLIAFVAPKQGHKLDEISKYLDLITKTFGEGSSIVWGTSIDKTMDECSRKLLIFYTS